jgi:hypothetical protein
LAPCGSTRGQPCRPIASKEIATSVTATVADDDVTVAWTAPVPRDEPEVATRGIAAHRIVAQPGGETVSVDPDVTSASFPDLAPGTYAFTVYAGGAAASTPSNSVTIAAAPTTTTTTATVPGATTTTTLASGPATQGTTVPPSITDTGGSGNDVGSDGGSLPVTGAPLALLALFGGALALVGAGLARRRRSTEGARTTPSRLPPR